jgi:hypothetical protein
MLEKIMKIMYPGLDKKIDSKRELLENREHFVKENEGTEDAVVMVEVLTSKNKIKRLQEEITADVENRRVAQIEMNNLLMKSNAAKEVYPITMELKKVSVILQGLRKKCLDNDIKGTGGVFDIQRFADIDGFKMPVFETMQNEVDAGIEKLEKIVAANENNKQNYPKLKKML